MNEAVFYNMDYCAFYFYMIANNLYEGFKSNDPDKSLLLRWMNFAKAFYSGPLAAKYCYKLVDSFTDIKNAYNKFMFTSYYDSLNFYAENLILNGIDMYYEL
jgi:hypothetical protein